MGIIFISYRQVDSDFAHRLGEKLHTHLEANTFIDIKNREEDVFDAINKALMACVAYVLVVTKNTFDSERIHRPDDWIRYEVKTALEARKPIALALSSDFKFPPPEDTTAIPSEIADIRRKQGIPFPREFFDEAVNQFVDHLIGISNGALKRRLSPEETCKQLKRRLREIDDLLLSNTSIMGDRRRNPTNAAQMDALREERLSVSEKLKNC